MNSSAAANAIMYPITQILSNASDAFLANTSMPSQVPCPTSDLSAIGVELMNRLLNNSANLYSSDNLIESLIFNGTLLINGTINDELFSLIALNESAMSEDLLAAVASVSTASASNQSQILVVCPPMLTINESDGDYMHHWIQNSLQTMNEIAEGLLVNLIMLNDSDNDYLHRLILQELESRNETMVSDMIRLMLIRNGTGESHGWVSPPHPHLPPPPPQINASMLMSRWNRNESESAHTSFVELVPYVQSLIANLSNSSEAAPRKFLRSFVFWCPTKSPSINFFYF